MYLFSCKLFLFSFELFNTVLSKRFSIRTTLFSQNPPLGQLLNITFLYEISYILTLTVQSGFPITRWFTCKDHKSHCFGRPCNCSNPLQIQQVFSFRLKKNFFVLGFSVGDYFTYDVTHKKSAIPNHRNFFRVQTRRLADPFEPLNSTFLVSSVNSETKRPMQATIYTWITNCQKQNAYVSVLILHVGMLFLIWLYGCWHRSAKWASHLNLDEWTSNIAMLNCFLIVNA